MMLNEQVSGQLFDVKKIQVNGQLNKKGRKLIIFTFVKTYSKTYIYPKVKPLYLSSR